MTRYMFTIVALLSFALTINPSFSDDTTNKATQIQATKFNFTVTEMKQKTIRPIKIRKIGIKQNCIHANRSEIFCS